MKTNSAYVDPPPMPPAIEYARNQSWMLETSASNLTLNQQAAIYLAIKVYVQKREDTRK